MNFEHRHHKKFLWIPLLVIAAIGIFGFLLMLLWNSLMPAIFGLPLINIYQAFGLLLLSKILFSGFGKGGHRHHPKNEWRKEFEKKHSCAHKESMNEGE